MCVLRVFLREENGYTFGTIVVTGDKTHTYGWLSLGKNVNELI